MMRPTTIHSRLATLLLLVASATAALAQSNAAPERLAVLAVDPALGAANDVLTAAFSKREGLLLLERAQIEEVYREQQLSAANQDLIKLGQILGADGLVILQTVTEGTNQFLQSRLIAVKPGVVLAEFRSPWPLENLVQWAGFAAEEFSPLLPKLTVLPKDAVPLSILNLRSPLRTAANQELERELTVLLIHRLTHEREVFVLERQHLSDALAEKEFAADDSPFWTGRYLLDGIIDKDGFDAATATVSARLASSQGGETVPIEVSGPRTNLNVLAESLVGKVLAALHRSSSAAAWDAAREADQFLDEARWAYRWKLMPEAAAAAESAWALGRRDKAVAEVRMNAYNGEVTLALYHDPHYAREILKPAPIEPAIRAQELFCENWRMGFTNGLPPNPAWYDLGLSIIHAGSEELESYNYFAELRPGHEESLAQLRSLLRQTLSILETNDARPLAQVRTDSIGAVECEMGGYWVEKPEDDLPVLRHLLERGFHPYQVPRLAAWSWADRQRIPKLLKRWLDDLTRDPNISVRLDGLLLSLLRAPNDGSGLREKLEQEYLDTIWENRRWFLDNETNLWPFSHVADLIRVQTGPFHIAPFIGLRQGIRMDYLSDPSAAHGGVYDGLFESGDVVGADPVITLPAADAAALLPLMEKFQPTWLSVTRRNRTLSILRKDAGLAHSPQPPPKPSAPAAKPLEANFVGWSGLELGSEAGWKRKVEDALSHEHKAVFKIRCVAPPIFAQEFGPNSHDRIAFVSIDTKGGPAREIAFPKIPEDPFIRSFDFSSNSIYALFNDKIHRYRIDRAEWEVISVPIEQAQKVVAFNGRVYVSAPDSLLELDPDTHNVRVIASSRRHPAQNVMDANWNAKVGLFARADGKLGAVYSDLDSIAFDPVSGVWENPIHLPLPATEDPAGPLRVLFYSPEGSLPLYFGRPELPHRLLALWNGAAAITNLLADAKLEVAKNLARPTEKALTEMMTLWDWPREFDLENSFFVVEDKSLWILTPRKFWYSWGDGMENTQFSDDRQATLFHFVPGSKAPLSVPLRFQDSVPAVNPFDPNQSGIRRQQERGRWGPANLDLVWLNTGDSLLLAVPNAPGYWRISKAALGARPLALKESPRSGGGPSGNTNSIPSGTNVILP